jgi:hypothetical protein
LGDENLPMKDPAVLVAPGVFLVAMGPHEEENKDVNNVEWMALPSATADHQMVMNCPWLWTQLGHP